MPDLMQWMTERDITNPHSVPDEYKDEFNALFDMDNIIWPQPGGQEMFLNCKADVCFFGGSAGGGKSYAIPIDALKWVGIPTFEAVVCRKTYAQMFDPGGMWVTADKILSKHGGRPKRGDKPQIKMPSGATIYFKHSQYSKDVERNWQGVQGEVIYVDEATQFDREEFNYILGRIRGDTGINGYIRCTCNPDPNSWVKELIKWFIGDDGFAIEERCGVVRYFVNENDQYISADNPEELVKIFPDCMPMSYTFIRGKVEENKCVHRDYVKKLHMQDESQKHRLLRGNWNEIENPNSMFPRRFFNDNRVGAIDFQEMERLIITIDPAGSTNNDSDETGIAVLGKKGEHVYVLNDSTGKYLPHEWADISIQLYHTYEADSIIAEKNFGGDMVANTIRAADDTIPVRHVNASRGKTRRFEPVAKKYAKGCVHHVGHGLKKAEDELHMFKPNDKNQKSPNRGDAIAWGVTELIIKPQSVAWVM